MKPTIGRIVYYRDFDDTTIYPAMIVYVPGGEFTSVNLIYWTENGIQHFRSEVAEALNDAKGCWFWPPRV